MAHQSAAPSDSGATFASASAAGNSNATSLARGKACLRCRKRKMRCDGAHPACAQCIRAHKGDGCQYDDGRGKTRTQALRERIVRLEAELQRLREGRGDSGSMSPGGREDSIFLMDPHAPPPPPSSSGSESAFGGELDFVDFGVDSFADSSASGMDIERPTTSLSDPASTPASGIVYSTEPLSFTSTDDYEGGVQRNRTIRPRDRLHASSSGGLREPRERHRPSSGVFGYSANHPLVQQAQGYSSAIPYHGHSRTSSTGSPSPSSSTVGSLGGHGQNAGTSPYSSYTEPLSLDLSPFHSPDPSMFAPAVPAFASATRYGYPQGVDYDSGLGINAETESTLIQLVLAHRDQVGFVIHPGRLLASLTPTPGSIRRHPVLKDAILLVGSRLARRACGSSIIGEGAENMLLKRVQTGVIDALRVAACSTQPFEQSRARQDGSGSVSPPMRGEDGFSAPALDALQSHILVAHYLFAEGRTSEARMHSSSAADLVLQLGLHQVRAPNANPATAHHDVGYPIESSAAMLLHLPRPADSIALGERVILFWAAFTLDRMLSAALGMPPCITDDDCAETRVDSPWPEEIEEYENIPMESVHGLATLRSFFIHQGLQVTGVSSGGFAPLALLSKASALHAACARTSANWGLHSPAAPPHAMYIASSCSSPASGQDQSIDDPAATFARLEACLARVASALLPAHQLSAGLPEGERRKQVVLHTLIHASVVRLHMRLARAGVGASLEKCVRAARASAALVRSHVGEKDYAVIDPLFGSCWTALVEVFSMEAVQASAATAGSSASAWVPHDQGALLNALTRLQGFGNTHGFSGVDSTSSSGA